MGVININNLFVVDNPLDILAVNETKLDSSIPDAQVCMSRYTCIRNDRTRSGGGGLAFTFETHHFYKNS